MLKRFESFVPKKVNNRKQNKEYVKYKETRWGEKKKFVDKIESHELVDSFEPMEDGFYEITFKDGSGATATPFWDGTEGISVSDHNDEENHGEVLDKKYKDEESFSSYDEFIDWYYSKIKAIHNIVKKK